MVRTKQASIAVAIVLGCAGLLWLAATQVAAYAHRAAFDWRLTHMVGGPSLNAGDRTSMLQLVAPALEFAVVVVVVAAFTVFGFRVRAGSQRGHRE